MSPPEPTSRRRPPRPPRRVEFLGSFPGRLPPATLPEVAFAGRSNVGKSSAINTLLGRKKAARTSKTPGRTQAVNLFELDGRIRFADLPGYGFARVPPEVQARWKDMVEGYLGSRETLRLVVVLVDGRHAAQKLDLEMLAGLRAAGLPHLVVATKIDRLKRNQQARALSRLRRELGVATGGLVPFSSVTRTGFDDVWDALDAACA